MCMHVCTCTHTHTKIAIKGELAAFLKIVFVTSDAHIREEMLSVPSSHLDHRW